MYFDIRWGPFSHGFLKLGLPLNALRAVLLNVLAYKMLVGAGVPCSLPIDVYGYNGFHSAHLASLAVARARLRPSPHCDAPSCGTHCEKTDTGRSCGVAGGLPGMRLWGPI